MGNYFREMKGSKFPKYCCHNKWGRSSCVYISRVFHGTVVDMAEIKEDVWFKKEIGE